jgi:hypothetical protein
MVLERKAAKEKQASHSESVRDAAKLTLSELSRLHGLAGNDTAAMQALVKVARQSSSYHDFIKDAPDALLRHGVKASRFGYALRFMQQSNGLYDVSKRPDSRQVTSRTLQFDGRDGLPDTEKLVIQYAQGTMAKPEDLPVLGHMAMLYHIVKNEHKIFSGVHK